MQQNYDLHGQRKERKKYNKKKKPYQGLVMHHLKPLLLLLLPGATVTAPDAPVMVVAVRIYCL